MKNENLTAVRLALGYKTQKDFATKLNISKEYLNKLEQGKKAISTKFIGNVCAVFPKVNRDYLEFGNGLPLHEEHLTENEEEIAFRFLQDTIDHLTPDRREVLVRIIKRLADDQTKYKISELKKNGEQGEDGNLQVPRRKVG